MTRLLTLPAGRRAKWSSSPRCSSLICLGGRLAVGEVRGRAGERHRLLPAGRRRVGEGARGRRAVPGRRARAGGDRLPARGRAAAADRERIAADVRELNADRPPTTLPAGDPILSENGDAALVSHAGALDRRRDRLRGRGRRRSATASAASATGSRSRSPVPRATASTRSRSSAASTGRCCCTTAAARPRPADRHLPVADLLGRSRSSRCCSPRSPRAASATCWPRRA